MIGIIPGTNSLLRDHYIAITAHYDGVGVPGGFDDCEEENGDAICNGAEDNASGSSALMEVARVLKTSNFHAPMPILFVLFAGEEAGLQGSEDFLKRFFNSPNKLGEIVTVINLDMVGHGPIRGIYGPEDAVTDDKQKTVGQSDWYFREIYNSFCENWFGCDDFELSNNVHFTDGETFYNFRIPSLLLMSAWNYQYTHKPSDEVDKVDRGYLEAATRLLVSLIYDFSNSYPVTITKIDEIPYLPYLMQRITHDFDVQQNDEKTMDALWEGALYKYFYYLKFTRFDYPWNNWLKRMLNNQYEWFKYRVDSIRVLNNSDYGNYCGESDTMCNNDLSGNVFIHEDYIRNNTSFEYWPTSTLIHEAGHTRNPARNLWGISHTSEDGRDCMFSDYGAFTYHVYYQWALYHFEEYLTNENDKVRIRNFLEEDVLDNNNPNQKWFRYVDANFNWNTGQIFVYPYYEMREDFVDDGLCEANPNY